MASYKQTKYSVAKAEKVLPNGRKRTVFLSKRDEQNGMDISLDMKGYKVSAL